MTSEGLMLRLHSLGGTGCR